MVPETPRSAPSGETGVGSRSIGRVQSGHTLRVTWSYGGPDPIAWLCIVSGVLFLGACVHVGWAFGAVLGGVFLGFIGTLYAFTTGHFRMSQRGGPDA